LQGIICRKCGDDMTAPLTAVQSYWNARPCNILHSKEAVGTKEYFDEVEARKYFVEPHIPAFADFPAWSGKRVLEIGCGIGTDTINFARAGAEVTAVDLSEVSLDIARQRAKVMGVADRITFIHGSVETLWKNVPIVPYDLIYSFGVIHHTPNPKKAIREIWGITYPGTEIKIMVYNKLSWKVLWILLTQGGWTDVAGTVARHSEAQTGCPVTYTYTLREARALVESGGFEVTNVQVDHIFPYSIPEYVQYQYKKVWYFRHIPPAAFRWLERQVGWHIMVDGVMN